jgi:hypothetical protein
VEVPPPSGQDLHPEGSRKVLLAQAGGHGGTDPQGQLLTARLPGGREDLLHAGGIVFIMNPGSQKFGFHIEVSKLGVEAIEVVSNQIVVDEMHIALYQDGAGEGGAERGAFPL